MSATPESIVARSNRAEVRNPALELPSTQKLLALPAESRAALRAVLLEIRSEAQVKAEKSWRTHKAPMAVYYKVVAVWFGHLARLLRDRPAT